ncbi:unnamed protein product [Ilex paraguariensis]|uniref:EGF-like domain-containing protein n=1 Tax=Ilex paraguariensis TaxID=185542 RepID=A0ABC8SAH1_9AQUA
MASAHQFHVLLVHLSILAFQLSEAPTATQATTAMVKPGCADRCGNLSIPYPFGITKDCCLDEAFLITCNDAFNPPIAFLGTNTSNLNVTEISLQGQLHILQFVGNDCYDPKGKWKEQSISEASFKLSKFSISTENKLTVIGCDTIAYMYFYQGEKLQRYSTTGCVSICHSLDSVADGSCSGVGCCQTSIPKRVRSIDIQLSSYNNYTKVSDFNHCGYAFVAKQNEFKFTPENVRKLQNTSEFPMVVDWAVGNETCEVAKKNSTTYACKDNTTCYKPDNGYAITGYRCKCLEGYEDINECQDLSRNNCTFEKGCHNMIGNYKCTCPEWYHGDGRKDGQGCTFNQSLVIKVALGNFTCCIFPIMHMKACFANPLSASQAITGGDYHTVAPLTSEEIIDLLVS